jgi:hypothetical protein
LYVELARCVSQGLSRGFLPFQEIGEWMGTEDAREQHLWPPTHSAKNTEWMGHGAAREFHLHCNAPEFHPMRASPI